jgi:hypothetical protein
VKACIHVFLQAYQMYLARPNGLIMHGNFSTYTASCLIYIYVYIYVCVCVRFMFVFTAVAIDLQMCENVFPLQ